MKTLLFILLVGYMIFGPTSNAKNENPSVAVESNELGLSPSQRRFTRKEKADRVLFLDADGKIVAPIAEN
jgi:hypothetical protein